jgi:acyl-coenzyme A synthetase/AMP-(fatty) acid ligase
MKLLYLGSTCFAMLGVPVAMDVQDGYTKAFAEIADRFGVWAAVATLLMLVIVVTTWLREKRMAKRIDELENDLVTVTKMQKDLQATIQLQNEVLKGLASQTNAQIDVLKEIKIIFSQKMCPFSKEYRP